MKTPPTSKTNLAQPAFLLRNRINHITITQARREDAPMIAQAIMMAVGEEICRDFAGTDHTLQEVGALFTELAALDDSQYSYLNTLVALDSEEKVLPPSRRTPLRRRAYEPPPTPAIPFIISTIYLFATAE